MSDDDTRLRQALRRAHADEPAPPFRDLAGARRRQPSRRRAGMAPVVLALAGALAACVLLLRRPRPAPPSGTVAPRVNLAALHVDSRGPLDFLLDVPPDPLLTSTPRFDTKGDWP